MKVRSWQQEIDMRQDFSGDWEITRDELLAAYQAGVRDFQGARLINVDFRAQDLSGINFHHANLQMCNFSNANLQRAKFDDAMLSRVDFQHADLRHAKMRCRFIGSDLRNANIAHAEVFAYELLGAFGVVVCSPLGTNSSDVFAVYTDNGPLYRVHESDDMLDFQAVLDCIAQSYDNELMRPFKDSYLSGLTFIRDVMAVQARLWEDATWRSSSH